MFCFVVVVVVVVGGGGDGGGVFLCFFWRAAHGMLSRCIVHPLGPHLKSS